MNNKLIERISKNVMVYLLSGIMIAQSWYAYIDNFIESQHIVVVKSTLLLSAAIIMAIFIKNYISKYNNVLSCMVILCAICQFALLYYEFNQLASQYILPLIINCILIVYFIILYIINNHNIMLNRCDHEKYLLKVFIVLYLFILSNLIAIKKYIKTETDEAHDKLLSSGVANFKANINEYANATEYPALKLYIVAITIIAIILMVYLYVKKIRTYPPSKY